MAEDKARRAEEARLEKSEYHLPQTGNTGSRAARGPGVNHHMDGPLSDRELERQRNNQSAGRWAQGISDGGGGGGGVAGHGPAAASAAADPFRPARDLGRTGPASGLTGSPPPEAWGAPPLHSMQHGGGGGREREEDGGPNVPLSDWALERQRNNYGGGGGGGGGGGEPVLSPRGQHATGTREREGSMGSTLAGLGGARQSIDVLARQRQQDEWRQQLQAQIESKQVRAAESLSI